MCKGNKRKTQINFRNIKGTFASHTVAMAIYCVTKMIITCSPVTGQFFDAMIVHKASSDKEWL